MSEQGPDKIKRVLGVRTPMRDGVELASDLWTPGGGKPSPLILLRTPYSKSAPPEQFEYSKLARFFAARGYAVAVQDVRGRGDSGGEFGYYFQEANDGFDTIEWMASQSWCNGRVGTMGVSYLGTVQWLAAAQKPPHLVCIASTAAPGDFFNELPYVGGAFLQHRLIWCNFVADRGRQTNVGQDEWAEIWEHRPLITADQELGRVMPLYRQWLLHNTIDDYWKPLVLSPDDYGRISLPALHITGWFDSNQSGAVYHWNGMARSRAERDQYLIIGPWDHQQTFFGGGKKKGELEFGEESILDIWHEHLWFFDKYLGLRENCTPGRRVRLYLTGLNEWRDFDEYPVRDVENRKLFLSSKGAANSIRGDGKLVSHSKMDEGEDHFIFDPKNPVPLDPLAASGIYGTDRQELENREDILVYTSDVLQTALESIGQVNVELFAASDAPDTDFTASILDVHPDGRAVVLGSRVVGILRGRYRQGFDSIKFTPPHEPAKYLIDLGHIAHCWCSGHRIRLEISSSASPLYNPNQNTGNPVAEDTEWAVARQTVFHSAKFPSALILPILNA